MKFAGAHLPLPAVFLISWRSNLSIKCINLFFISRNELFYPICDVFTGFQHFWLLLQNPECGKKFSTALVNSPCFDLNSLCVNLQITQLFQLKLCFVCHNNASQKEC